ncbi:hypothetical protein K474DRAFT_1655414 [Panus rudis PR-1116 ss-1]|nr:hypothetical protein K474DRAFT_1655414 [Panus rudis PR-1116 ss-1]
MNKRESGINALPDLRDVSTPFLILHIIGGHVGLPILVSIFVLSNRTRRPPSLVNMCLTWILFSISHSLMFYGGWQKHRDPPFALCLIQAGLIHAAPPMCLVAVLAVVLQVYYLFQPPWSSLSFFSRYDVPHWARLAVVLLPPYIVYVVIAVVTIVVGLHNPDTIVPTLGLYCTINITAFFAIPAFCAIFMIIVFIINIGSLVQYYRNWQRMKALSSASERRSLNVWIRVFAFNLYAVATLGACVLYFVTPTSPLPYLIEAALPLVALLLFGSQKDILRRLIFCRRRGGTSDERDYGGGWSVRSSASHQTSTTIEIVVDSERGTNG